MIRSIALVLATVTSATVFAQNAHEAMIPFNKTQESAVVADFDNPPEVVKQVLKAQLEKEGLGKIKSSGGYWRSNGSVWHSVSSDKMDFYFRVEGKRNKSTISVLVSKGYDNFVTSGTDSRTVDNVKNFLNSFGDQLAAYQKEQDIKAQEEAVKKAEALQKKAVERQAKLDKQKAAQQKALEAERQKLNNIKASAN